MGESNYQSLYRSSILIHHIVKPRASCAGGIIAKVGWGTNVSSESICANVIMNISEQSNFDPNPSFVHTYSSIETCLIKLCLTMR